jgi:hypothetical protein
MSKDPSIIDTSHIQATPQAVTPLPVGSGGSNITKQEMNNTNEALTALSVQASADKKYDPVVPVQAPVVLGFRDISDEISVIELFIMIGTFCIVYGVVAK